MQKKSRKLDLIVFGATGFTGRQAADYLAKHVPASMSWAVCGRNQVKLDELVTTLLTTPRPPSRSFVADHANLDSVKEIVSQARVILNFAGPFARYSSNVIAACAQTGTHYVDITGETGWVGEMIERYEGDAVKSGAVLIPFAGFDSIPSDLGAWRVEQLAQRAAPGQVVTQITSLFTVQGGINGGTFATMLDMLKEGSMPDSDALVPKDDRSQFGFKDARRPVRTPQTPAGAAPFFMAPINSRVVYRSQALRKNRLGASAKSWRPFEYVELLKPSKRLPRVQAWGLTLGTEVLQRVGSFPVGLKLLELVGPRAGDGPSAKSRENGYFRARFYAYHKSQLLAACEMSCDGDPGNKATVLMICEAAFCLLSESEKEKLPPGGFWTPSTALGEPLRARLLGAGMRFEDSIRPRSA